MIMGESIVCNLTFCIGSDLGGFDLKEIIKNYLDTNKIKFKDFGIIDKKK